METASYEPKLHMNQKNWVWENFDNPKKTQKFNF